MPQQPPTPQFQFEYEKYTNAAFYRRGLVINETIFLERAIDDFISSYFCQDSDKKRELMELIIYTNRMIFENKVQVLKFLLERHNPDVLKSSPTFINDILQKIIPERNIFAHYWLVTSTELTDYLKENKTVVVRYKNTIDHLEYDDNRISELMALIGKCIRVMLDPQPAQ
jgi:hypothetical protein